MFTLPRIHLVHPKHHRSSTVPHVYASSMPHPGGLFKAEKLHFYQTWFQLNTRHTLVSTCLCLWWLDRNVFLSNVSNSCYGDPRRFLCAAVLVTKSFGGFFCFSSLLCVVTRKLFYIEASGKKNTASVAHGVYTWRQHEVMNYLLKVPRHSGQLKNIL